MQIFYIYLINNKINGKQYVGFTDNTIKRWKEHCKAYGSCPALHKAIKKYGKENFSFEIIYCSLDFEHTLFTMEEFFIKQFNTFGSQGYNMSYGGTSNRRGIPWTREQKLLVSLRRKGKKTSLETKKKISEALKGHIKTDEWKKKLQIAQTGKKLSEETKNKMSLASKGKPKSQSHKANLVISNRRKLYLITYPDGSQIQTNSLSQFAKDNNLSQSGLSRCVTGEQKFHKGYKVVELNL